MGTLKMKPGRIVIWHLLLLPLFLFGQADSLSIVERSLPVLNKHYFIPVTNFESPFITTFFKTGIGGGSTLNKYFVSLLNGKVEGTLNAENTFVMADVHVQVKAKNWLAVWFRYGANVRIGSSKPTILAQGITSITGFEFGWMLQLMQNKFSQLSATANIQNSNISAINLGKYVSNVINHPDSIYTKITNKRNPLSGGVGLRYAYAINEMLGFRAYTNATYGESFHKKGENVWTFDLGFLGDVNFAGSHNIPFALSLGYSIQKFALFEEAKSEDTQLFIAKVAYTGREEYNIGLEFTYQRSKSPLADYENSIEYLMTTFVMVYYF